MIMPESNKRSTNRKETIEHYAAITKTAFLAFTRKDENTSFGI